MISRRLSTPLFHLTIKAPTSLNGVSHVQVNSNSTWMQALGVMQIKHAMVAYSGMRLKAGSLAIMGFSEVEIEAELEMAVNLIRDGSELSLSRTDQIC
ncbi:hypothetical protein ACSBR1_024744 [Camellia fascicularis]